MAQRRTDRLGARGCLHVTAREGASAPHHPLLQGARAEIVGRWVAIRVFAIGRRDPFGVAEPDRDGSGTLVV